MKSNTRLILVASILGLFACAGSKPDDVVKSFLTAGSQDDANAMADTLQLSSAALTALRVTNDQEAATRMTAGIKPNADKTALIHVGQPQYLTDTDGKKIAKVPINMEGEEGTEHFTLQHIDGQWKIILPPIL